MDEALDLTMKVEQLAQTCTIPLIASHAAAMQALIWVARGNIAVARHWVREAQLSVKDELSYAREFEHMTLARVLLAQGQYETALPFPAATPSRREGRGTKETGNRGTRSPGSWL